MIPNILNEEDIDVLIEEIVIIKDFQKSNTEIQNYESIEELKFPQEYNDGGVIILDDLNEKEINDPRIQAIFKRSRHNKLSLFIFFKITRSFPKRPSEQMAISIISSKQTISQMLKTFIKTRLLWTRH